MAYIKKGDFIIGRTGKKYIAASDDYTKRIAGTGEFLDDWSFRGAVDLIDPETGVKSWAFTSEVTKVST